MKAMGIYHIHEYGLVFHRLWLLTIGIGLTIYAK